MTQAPLSPESTSATEAARLQPRCHTPAAPAGASQKAAPAKAPVSAAPRQRRLGTKNVGYKGFFIKSDDGLYTLKLNGRSGRAMTRPSPKEGTRSRPPSSSRLKIKGTAFTKDLSYKFQIDFGKGEEALKSSTSTTGSSTLGCRCAPSRPSTPSAVSSCLLESGSSPTARSPTRPLGRGVISASCFTTAARERRVRRGCLQRYGTRHLLGLGQ